MPAASTRPADDLLAATAALAKAGLVIAEYDRKPARGFDGAYLPVPLRFRIRYASARKRFVAARAAYLAAYPHMAHKVADYDGALGFTEQAVPVAS